MTKLKRPIAISFQWVDPWTGAFLAGARMPYTPQRAAKSAYSITIKRFKKLAQQDCGLRTPKLLLTIHYPQKGAA